MISTREKRPGFWVQDCAAATQNLLLAAHAAGLGAVWCGTYPREERMGPIAAVLGLPEHVIPFSVVPIGYPAERPAPADRYDPEPCPFRPMVGRDSMKKSLGPGTWLYPTPVFVVGTYDAAGKPNVMTVAWGGICCSKPPCVAISVRKATYTYGNLMERRAFTISLPSEDQVVPADYFGVASGRDTDKFAAAGLTPVRAASWSMLPTWANSRSCSSARSSMWPNSGCTRCSSARSST